MVLLTRLLCGQTAGNCRTQSHESQDGMVGLLEGRGKRSSEKRSGCVAFVGAIIDYQPPKILLRYARFWYANNAAGS